MWATKHTVDENDKLPLKIDSIGCNIIVTKQSFNFNILMTRGDRRKMMSLLGVLSTLLRLTNCVSFLLFSYSFYVSISISNHSILFGVLVRPNEDTIEMNVSIKIGPFVTIAAFDLLQSNKRKCAFQPPFNFPTCLIWLKWSPVRLGEIQLL